MAFVARFTTQCLDERCHDDIEPGQEIMRGTDGLGNKGWVHVQCPNPDPIALDEPGGRWDGTSAAEMGF